MWVKNEVAVGAAAVVHVVHICGSGNEYDWANGGGERPALLRNAQVPGELAPVFNPSCVTI